MAIRSIMHTHLVVVGPGETVAVATRRLAEHELGALLVMDGDKLVGVFSERDLVKRVIAAGKDPNTTFVGEVSTKDPVTAPVTCEVQDCYRILKEKNFRHLPIVSEDGKPVGIVSARDFFQFMVVGLSQRTDLTDFFANVGTMQIDPYGD